MICPECGTKMAKAGGAASGRRKVQKYKCSKCRRTVTDTKTLFHSEQRGA